MTFLPTWQQPHPSPIGGCTALEFARVPHTPCPHCHWLESVALERHDELYDQFKCPGCGHRWLVPRGTSAWTVVVTPKPPST